MTVMYVRKEVSQVVIAASSSQPASSTEHACDVFSVNDSSKHTQDVCKHTGIYMKGIDIHNGGRG